MKPSVNLRKTSIGCLPTRLESVIAEAIALKLEDVSVPRPMTHDLLINVLESLKSEIHSVSISRMKNGTIFAEIKIFNSQVGEIIIDSRPSDAIAVALRTLTPIYVSDQVMERIGIDNYKIETNQPESTTIPIANKQKKSEDISAMMVQKSNAIR